MIAPMQKFVAILTLAMMGVAAEAKSGAATSEAGTTIAAALDPFVTDKPLAGYVIVLMKDGKLVATNVKGYADLDTRRTLKKDAIFRIYSMTKPVTGVALMILHDWGKWKFSDPVAKFLPELANLKVYQRVHAAGTWFWIDPAHKIVFVGMIQRLAALGGPDVQGTSQRAVASSFELPLPN